MRQKNTILYQTKHDYNVVFRPSTDEDSFDSFKLGTARVHRYSDPDSGMDDSEYIMWYHARDPSLNSADNSLPPLSTGRIGRATSRNGLVWERDEDGSNDADREGVALGLNTESWWGFDTAHVGLGQVLMPMTGPAIRSEGGVYMMYYMGGSYEETKIAEYTEREVPEDAMIKGMKLKIGTAISQDGVTWGRVEGNDPSGACMVPYDASDVNMEDVAGSKDENGQLLDIPEELYCGWPEVVVNPVNENENEEKAMKDTSRNNFVMYYSTMLKDTKEKSIGYAVSYNGFAWSKRGIVLKPSGPLDGAGCARSNVIKKATLNEEGFWKEEENGWIMFYEGVSSEDGRHRILAAESDDLKNWNKLGLVMDVGEGEDAWDSKGVGSPHCIRLDGYFRMYYTGEGADGQTAIGVAKSLDLSSWEKEQAEVSFAFE